MTKETFVFIAGILLILVPFIGIPETWRQYTIVGLGIILLLVGYALRRAIYFTKIDKGNGERGNDAFVETTEPLFTESDFKS